jgi:hypothetical protein
MILLLLQLGCFGHGSEESVPQQNPTVTVKPIHQQIMLVESVGWQSREGSLRRFQWSNQEGWELVGDRVDVKLGESGMAWGVGLYSWPIEEATEAKIEGDARTPAGIFSLGSTFGTAQPQTINWSLPYLSTHPNLLCVRDTGSVHYNTIVNQLKTNRDWNDFDVLRREDGVYKWGVVIAHNPQNKPPGGACMFLHSQPKKILKTASGIAVPEKELLEILQWLLQEANPIVVIAPQPETSRLLSVLQKQGVILSVD